MCVCVCVCVEGGGGGGRFGITIMTSCCRDGPYGGTSLYFYCRTYVTEWAELCASAGGTSVLHGYHPGDWVLNNK